MSWQMRSANKLYVSSLSPPLPDHGAEFGLFFSSPALWFLLKLIIFFPLSWKLPERLNCILCLKERVRQYTPKSQNNALAFTFCCVLCGHIPPLFILEVFIVFGEKKNRICWWRHHDLCQWVAFGQAWVFIFKLALNQMLPDADLKMVKW